MTDDTTETQPITIAQFITDNCLKATSLPVKRNPHMDDPKWKANHYEVELIRHWPGCGHGPTTHRLITYFSKGEGHVYGPKEPFHRRGKPIPPTAAEVLDCLASDAYGVDPAGTGIFTSFENWADEYGYERDSRKAEATYDVCVKQAKELREFLGNLYQKLLFEVERL